MQLGIVLILIAALLLDQAAPHAAVPDASYRTMACALLLALLVLVARFVAVATAMGMQCGDGNILAWPARRRQLRSLHTGAWVVVLAAIYAGLGWSQVVRENWGLRGSILIDDLLVLAPVIISLLLIWWSFETVELSSPATKRGRRFADLAADGACHPVWQNARYLLLPVLAPLLAVLTVQDILEYIGTAPLSPAVQAALGILSLILLLAGFPFALRSIWRTESVKDAALRKLLGRVEQRLGVRPQDVLLWHTGGTICNALVVGVFPGCRYVLLSDLLLERLGPSQIAALYGHELGHIRHGHPRLRLLAVILPILTMCGFRATAEDWCAAAASHLSFCGVQSTWLLTALYVALAALYARFPFSWYCCALEHQADLAGCDALAEMPRGSETRPVGNGEPIASALALLAPSSAHGRKPSQYGWFHPSLADRLAFIRQSSLDASARSLFQRRMRRLGWLLAVLIGIAAALALAC